MVRPRALVHHQLEAWQAGQWTAGRRSLGGTTSMGRPSSPPRRHAGARPRAARLQHKVAKLREPGQEDAKLLTRGLMAWQVAVRSIQAAEASILYAEGLAPTVAPGAL